MRRLRTPLWLILGAAVVLAAAVGAGSAGERVAVSTASGETLAFDPPEIHVPATGSPGLTIRLEFRNGSSIEHNLTFLDPIVAGTRTIVAPGEREEFVIRAPGPGSYTFICTIHDGMAGKLIVEPFSGA